MIIVSLDHRGTEPKIIFYTACPEDNYLKVLCEMVDRSGSIAIIKPISECKPLEAITTKIKTAKV